MGLWKVRPDADPAMIKRAQDKVARFTELLPGCLEAAVAPLYVPEMSAADQEAFGASAGGFAEMAHLRLIGKNDTGVLRIERLDEYFLWFQ